MTLFKRSTALDAPWHFKFEFRGETYPRTTSTADKKLALQVARAKKKLIIEAVIRGDLAAIESTKTVHRAGATIAQIITLYKTAPVRAAAGTRTQYTHALENLLTVAAVYDRRSTTITLLNRDTMRAWFQRARDRAAAVGDQRRANSIMRSANSIAAMARCLFIPAAIEHYRLNKIESPLFREFFESFHAYKFQRIPRRTQDIPSEAVISVTLVDWEKLEDRNLFLAIGHELAFGLRKGDMAQARWSWWTTRNGHYVLDSNAGEGRHDAVPDHSPVHVKNHTGLIQVVALDPWFTTMRLRVEREAWHSSLNPQPSTDYILSGTDTQRTENVFRDVSRFLRDHGWNTQKTNHALRDYAGSLVNMKYGANARKNFLRHSSVQVGEQHYDSFTNVFTVDPETVPISWAKVDRAFEPKVMNL